MSAAPYNWAEWVGDNAVARRMEQENAHSLSVQARYEQAETRVRAALEPALEVARDELYEALAYEDADRLVSALRRLSSVGELARFEAEKLDGRA